MVDVNFSPLPSLPEMQKAFGGLSGGYFYTKLLAILVGVVDIFYLS